jgi:hypothetical protein
MNKRRPSRPGDADMDLFKRPMCPPRPRVPLTAWHAQLLQAALGAVAEPVPVPSHVPTFVSVSRPCALCHTALPPASRTQHAYSVDTHPAYGLLCPACWDSIERNDNV